MPPRRPSRPSLDRHCVNTYHQPVPEATLSAHSKVRRLERLAFAPLDHECLAIDAAAGHLYSLNETGRSVWDAIVEPTAVSELVDRLVASFDVDQATCERDVLAVLSALCGAGLAEVVDAR